MGSITMPSTLVLLAVVFALGVSSEEADNEKKPEVVDWEEKNFGIRTSHNYENSLHRLNIDTNAPHIPKRIKPKHKPRRNEKKELKLINNLRIRKRNKVNNLNVPGELGSTTKDTKKQDITPSGRSGSANYVARRKTLRTSSETKQTRVNSGTSKRTGGFRSPRFRSRIPPRARETTEAITGVDILEDTLTSSLKLKPNFAEFKEKFLMNISRSQTEYPEKNLDFSEQVFQTFNVSSKLTTTTTAMPIITATTTITTSTTSTTASTSTLTAKSSSAPTTTGSKTKSMAVSTQTLGTEKKGSEETSSNADVIDNISEASYETSTDHVKMTTIVEVVTDTTTNKVDMKNDLWARKKTMDRKIPDIGDPAVKEKLNRLTSLGRGNVRRRNKNPDNTSPRRETIARTRATMKVGSSSNSHTEDDRKNVLKEEAEEDLGSSKRLRIRRPPAFNHRFRPNKKVNHEDSGVPRSIKRMKVKGIDDYITTKDSGNVDKEEKDTLMVKEQPRIRISSGRRAPSSQISSTERRKGSPVRRLHNPSGRKGYLTTIATTSMATTANPTIPTTEKITISPNAHKISYTLNDSDDVDITSENPIAELDSIDEIGNEIDHPVAQELISVVPIPDNMFSQATHQLMRAKKTSLKTFLPTLVPLIRKTPSKSQVPVFVAGTNQSEERLENAREDNLPQSVNRGRYILAATSQG